MALDIGHYERANRADFPAMATYIFKRSGNEAGCHRSTSELRRGFGVHEGYDVALSSVRHRRCSILEGQFVARGALVIPHNHARHPQFFRSVVDSLTSIGGSTPWKMRCRHFEASARDCTYSGGYCRPAMTPPSTERMTPVIHFA